MSKEYFFKPFLWGAIFILTHSFLPNALSQETNSQRAVLSEMLSGYFSNSTTLQKLSLSLENALLASDATNIQNSFSFTIQSGTITYVTGNNSSVTFSPSATLLIPQADNLKISLSSEIKLFPGQSKDASIKDTTLSASFDILSSTQKERNITLLRSERTVTEAKRALQEGYMSVEKEFYTSLKSLYSTASSLTSAQKELYEDTQSLEELTAKGYSTASSKYRTALMEVQSSNRTVELKKRELERETRIFASKCGSAYDAQDALAYLPIDIPAVEPVKIKDFDADTYTKTEAALWTQYINGLEREAERDITITGNVGYTFFNSSTQSDTLDIGASIAYNDALSVSAGVSLPLWTESFNPVYTLGFSVNPTAFLLSKIEKQQEDIKIQTETLDIKDARADYETEVISRRTELGDLMWAKDTDIKSYELYTELESDLSRYYRMGYIKESEYLNAVAGKENYRIACLIDGINLIIYNIETSLLFTPDEETIKEE